MPRTGFKDVVATIREVGSDDGIVSYLLSIPVDHPENLVMEAVLRMAADEGDLIHIDPAGHLAVGIRDADPKRDRELYESDDDLQPRPTLH